MSGGAACDPVYLAGGRARLDGRKWCLSEVFLPHNEETSGLSHVAIHDGPRTRGSPTGNAWPMVLKGLEPMRGEQKTGLGAQFVSVTATN